MSNIVPRKNDALTPVRLTRRAVKQYREVDASSEIELMKLDRQAQIGTARVRTVTRVGTRAMEAQAIVSMTQRMIVEMEPSAVHGVSHLSQRLTLGLGQVIDRTINEVT